MFEKGASATENSLVNVGRSLIVENNYGYDVLEPFAAKPDADVRARDGPRRRQRGRHRLQGRVDAATSARRA